MKGFLFSVQWYLLNELFLRLRNIQNGTGWKLDEKYLIYEEGMECEIKEHHQDELLSIYIST